MRKCVHLVGYFHVHYLMLYMIMLNVIAYRSTVPGSNSLPSTQTLKSPFRTSSEFVFFVKLRLFYVRNMSLAQITF